MVKHEVLYALLGHSGDLIAFNEDEEVFRCTALAKSMLCAFEVQAIDQIVQHGHRFRDFYEFLEGCFDFDDEPEEEYKYISVYGIVLDRFIRSYEEKIMELERLCKKDPALGLGFLASELSASGVSDWILPMHDILIVCIKDGHQNNIGAGVQSMSKPGSIFEYVHELSVVTLSGDNSLETLKTTIYNEFFHNVMNHIQFNLPLPKIPQFVSPLTRHQLEFIHKCIHVYKIIYIPMEIMIKDEHDSSSRSRTTYVNAIDFFERQVNFYYQEYNRKAFELCKDGFENDIKRLENTIIMEVNLLTVENYDESESKKDIMKYEPTSPILTPHHLEKFAKIQGYIEKTQNAIATLNESFGKKFSPYRSRLTLIMNQILLFQKTQVMIDAVRSSNSFTSLISSLDDQLFTTFSILEKLDKCLAEFFTKLPRRIRSEDYRRFYTNLKESESGYGIGGTRSLTELAVCLNWNGWIESESMG